MYMRISRKWKSSDWKQVLEVLESQFQLIYLDIVCVCFSYTKPKGQLPDYEAPVVMKSGETTLEDFCNKIHKSIMKDFKQYVSWHSFNEGFLGPTCTYVGSDSGMIIEQHLMILLQ